MHLTRRYFLRTTGALAAYVGVSPMNLFAMPGSGREEGGPRSGERGHLGEPEGGGLKVTKGKTLVVVFLRGGADGLNLIVPHGDASYAGLRKSIGLAGPASKEKDGARVIDLDGFFGLHPRLAPLATHFDSGLMRAAHAVGYDKNTRSHFEEQDVWETGIIGNTVNSDGWVNRHLATSEGHGPVRAVAIGDALPRILHGKAPAYAIRGVEDLTLPGRGKQKEAIKAGLEHAYGARDLRQKLTDTQNAREMLSAAGGVTLEGIEQLRPLIGAEYKPDAVYPSTGLGRQLMQVARLIKANVGLEVAEVDYGGWDTHQNQGQAAGQYADLVGGLADALAAFAADLESRMDDVLVVTLTDFGRTAAENGTGGTDHGWANCMLAMGGPALRASKADAAAGKGRKVVTNWPGLAPDQLHEKRDLLHTTDFRDVLSELVSVHLGNTNLGAVLPNHEVKPVGLVSA